jgi:hypothetical protein
MQFFDNYDGQVLFNPGNSSTNVPPTLPIKKVREAMRPIQKELFLE